MIIQIPTEIMAFQYIRYCDKMIELIAVICTMLAFLGTVYLSKRWIIVAKNINLIGKDMNKYSKPPVAEGGGVAIIIAVIFSILAYIFFKTFLMGSNSNLINIFAILTTVTLAGFIGFMDDVLGWLKGLRQRTKVLLTIMIALPLVVINAGQSTVILPCIGTIDFGLLYPLLIVPIAIIGAANGYNLLAGYNGLEAGMGVVIVSTLSYIALLNGYLWLTMIGIITVASLIGFLMFNWYPSKIFPGDSMTYTLGALIASMAILGNMQTVAVILFIPYFIDALFLVRARNTSVVAFAIPDRNNALKMPYKKCYDTTHLAIYLIGKFKKNVYERDVVLSILGLEALLGVICIAFL